MGMNVILEHRARGSGDQRYHGMLATIRQWSSMNGWALASIGAEHAVPWRVGHWRSVSHAVEAPNARSACDIGRCLTHKPSADCSHSHVEDVDVILTRKCSNSGKAQFEGQ